MKTVAIVAGGTLDTTLLPEIQKQTKTIGVDRGAWWLLEHRIIPDYAIGDFDSVSVEEMKKIKDASPNVVQYEAEKNETDLELAVQLAISLDFDRILIIGSIGSRMDHSLAGIFLLEQFEDKQIEIIDTNNRIQLITKTTTIVHDPFFQYCSFLPLTYRAVISLEGFKYPLQSHTVYRNKTLCISNEFESKKAKIIVHEGKIVCIQSSG